MDPSIVLLVVSFGLLALLFSRGRRQQREAAMVQAQLVPGAEVMTGSGLFATVVSVEDTAVVLATAPGQHSRWDRRAVARIMTPAPEPASEGESGADPGADPGAAGVGLTKTADVDGAEAGGAEAGGADSGRAADSGGAADPAERPSDGPDEGHNAR